MMHISAIAMPRAGVATRLSFYPDTGFRRSYDICRPLSHGYTTDKKTDERLVATASGKAPTRAALHHGVRD